MELLDIVRYLGALLLVLALVGAAAIVVKRYGVPGVIGGKGRRINILETVMLGKNHRLLLVKCDGIEHLLAMGPQGATVVNSKAAESFSVAVASAVASAPDAAAAPIAVATWEDIAA